MEKKPLIYKGKIEYSLEIILDENGHPVNANLTLPEGNIFDVMSSAINTRKTFADLRTEANTEKSSFKERTDIGKAVNGLSSLIKRLLPVCFSTIKAEVDKEA